MPSTAAQPTDRVLIEDTLRKAVEYFALRRENAAPRRMSPDGIRRLGADSLTFEIRGLARAA